MALATTQKVQFPETYNNLRHFVKKIAYLILCLVGEQAILTTSLMLVLKHICKFEMDYTYHFAEFPKFGAYFLNKIHVGTQKYIHSCVIRSPNRVQ